MKLFLLDYFSISLIISICYEIRSQSDSAQWRQWVYLTILTVLTGVDLVHWLLNKGPEAAVSDSVKDVAKADVLHQEIVWINHNINSITLY